MNCTCKTHVDSRHFNAGGKFAPFSLFELRSDVIIVSHRFAGSVVFLSYADYVFSNQNKYKRPSLMSNYIEE